MQPEQIISTVAKYFQVSDVAVKRLHGIKKVCTARHMAVALLYESGMLHVEIGRLFNNRSAGHSFSVKSYQCHVELLHNNQYRLSYETLRNMTKQRLWQDSSEEAISVLQDAQCSHLKNSN